MKSERRVDNPMLCNGKNIGMMEEINNTEVRNNIIEAAVKAFHKDGIKAVTMDHIAHLLSMSKRTLYQVFRDKESLLLACIKKHQEEERLFIEKTKCETDNVLEILLKLFTMSLDDVRHVNPKFFTEMRKYPNIVAYHREVSKKHAIEGVAFMQKGIEQGIFKKNIKFEIVVPFMQSKMDMLINNDIFEGYTIREIFVNTIMVMLRGCCTEKGTEMIDKFIEQWNLSEQALPAE